MPVRAYGPMFDGTGAHAMHEFVDELSKTVATGVRVILTKYYGEFFKNPTGYYESQTVVTTKAYATRSVNDSGVIYGPWLAGTGSRNKTSRFKGYKHWRLAMQEGRAMVKPAAAWLWRQYAARMGGIP